MFRFVSCINQNFYHIINSYLVYKMLQKQKSDTFTSLKGIQRLALDLPVKRTKPSCCDTLSPPCTYGTKFQLNPVQAELLWNNKNVFQ